MKTIHGLLQNPQYESVLSNLRCWKLLIILNY